MNINIDEIKVRALEKAQPHFKNPLKIVSIGQNDKYLTITMSYEGLKDGFECPNYIVNKSTGKELYCPVMLGIEDLPGFNDFSWGDLTFDYL